MISHEYPVLHANPPLHPDAARNKYLLDSGYPDRSEGRPPAANFKEGQRYIDFSRADVRAWWWRQHRDLVALGIEGWWLDGGEGPPVETTLNAGPSAILHNRYDLLRQQAFAEGEAADRPDRRPYLLCRSGGPGMQRFGAMPWSGDINTTFEVMEAQIRIGLNAGMSGVPHWGTDIGGFYRVAPDAGELFARWFQFGAFCSVFRGHGFVWRYHLPWSHGEEIEAICRCYLELRYRLMPYTYTRPASRPAAPTRCAFTCRGGRAWSRSTARGWPRARPRAARAGGTTANASCSCNCPSSPRRRASPGDRRRRMDYAQGDGRTTSTQQPCELRLTAFSGPTSTAASAP